MFFILFLEILKRSSYYVFSCLNMHVFCSRANPSTSSECRISNSDSDWLPALLVGLWVSLLIVRDLVCALVYVSYCVVMFRFTSFCSTPAAAVPSSFPFPSYHHPTPATVWSFVCIVQGQCDVMIVQRNFDGQEMTRRFLFLPVFLRNYWFEKKKKIGIYGF